MKKVRKLIGKIKAGNNIALAMDKKMREIKTQVFTFYKDFKVRWNTTYKMLIRLFDLQTVYDFLTINAGKIDGLSSSQISDLNKLSLEAEEWALLKCLKRILEPIYFVTNELQKQSYPTMALSKVMEKTLLDKYSKLKKNSGNKTIQILANSIYTQLEHHLVGKISENQNNIALVCIFY